ncbi:hypothetical protein ACOMSG_00155 [Macellibacteroides fermentans]|uniref:hypothetical protein n=1 Tax=Macellibacteroides fermentans TaxID=879969 RepID=UPI003B9401ED
MKQVKQIIEFILVVASCFFRKRKQQKVHPYVPEDPYPPGSCNGGKGDCPGCPGCNCNPQSEAATGQSDVYGQSRTVGQGYQPVSIGNDGAANLLGWCLIAVAGTSYLYKLLTCFI